MPKMPEGEKKEESAESLAEKKEQVNMCYASYSSNNVKILLK